MEPISLSSFLSFEEDLLAAGLVLCLTKTSLPFLFSEKLFYELCNVPLDAYI